MTSQSQINWWGSVCSIVVTAVAGVKWLAAILQPPSSGVPLHNLASLQRLQTILFLGLAAAALHGVLWLLAERAFRWNFDAGAESLPHGWSAVALSLTMTIPLVLLPPLYARFTYIQVVPPGHWVAALFVLLFAAVGHVFLYGAKAINFPGIRNILFPLNSAPSRYRALQSEFAYAATHFGSIALVYRVVVWSRVGPLNVATILPALISAIFWFSAVSIFIFLYPDSLASKEGTGVRGVLNALMLTITLQGGMLM